MSYNILEQVRLEALKTLFKKVMIKKCITEQRAKLSSYL